jgi:hypothetical protein
VYENTQKVSGLVQSAQYTASIKQQSTGSNNNTACVTQAISLDGSNTNTNGKATTADLQAHQSILISQDNSGAGTNSAQNAATSTGACDTSSQLTQSQTLTSTVTATGTITQRENANYALCGDGDSTDYANLCLRIDQNQSSGYKCTTTCGSAATNFAAFTQNSTQTAVANSTKGAAVAQTQSAAPCGTNVGPSGCVAGSGLVGTINQDSSGVSTANPTQNEVQCEDAAISGLTSCSHTADTSTLPSSKLTQNQYGPVGVGNLPTHHPGRVLFVHLKGLGQAKQVGNTQDQYTINQYSTQYADVGAFQQNFGKADCATAGFCTAAQTTTVNGTSTSDGYTAPSIPTLTITCPTGQTCAATPPPTPTLTGMPPATNPSSSGTFSWTDDATAGITFKCKFDNGGFTTNNCSSGVSFFQGYGPHSFQVEAVDNTASHNASAPTAVYNWTNVPPDPAINASSEPANPEAWGGTDTFQFTDPDSTVHFQCTLDGNTTSCNTGSKSYPSLSSGEHTFSVQAYDTTDTYGSINSATYTWWITPPNPTIDTKPVNPDFFGSSDFVFSDQDTTVQYRCQIDSQPVASCTSPKSYSSLDPGSHTFTVTAYGATDSGFTHPDTTPATYTWTILPLAVSALGGDDLSSAGWACQPGGPIGLTVGSAPYDPPTSDGTFAQVAITNAAGTLIDDLPEPTFTTDNFNNGSPRYVIDLEDGHHLWGYPPNEQMGTSAMLWDGSDGYGTTWSQIQTLESGQHVVDALVIADGDQDAGTTDKIGSLQFNGTTYNSGTCS